MRSFNWKNGWVFERDDAKNVRIRQAELAEYLISIELVIPSSEWDSICQAVDLGDQAEPEREDCKPIEKAVAAERERCIEILQRARQGEVDGDLRCLIHRMKYPE